MRERLATSRTVVVEGRYDAVRLGAVLDAEIICTGGFDIFRDSEKQKLLKNLGQRNGILLLTDPDSAGFRIRTLVTNLVGEKNILQVYVPAVYGKEKRKAEPGKEGLLGVEGIETDEIYAILKRAIESDNKERNEETLPAVKITYTDLYEWGLSGTAGAAERRRAFDRRLGLPPRLSKKELVEVLNRLYTKAELQKIAAEL